MKDAQHIRLKVSGKEYEMYMPTPEAEHLARLGAERVNRELDRLHEDYPLASSEEIMAIVALREAASAVELQDKVKRLEREVNSLSADLEAYLNGMK